ncbi:oligosaccharyl transferase glycoprotein complex, beta subunit [Rhizina undulata]
MRFQKISSSGLVYLLGMCAATIVSAVSTTGERLLVVLENEGDREGYSQFFGDLEGRGFELSFQNPKSEGLSLFQHGERAWDHVILFPPKSKGYGPSLTPQNLLTFMQQKGNIMVLTSPNSTPEQTRELARELDISLPPRDYLVVDHFSYHPSAAEKHDIVLVPRPAASSEKKNYFAKEGEVIAYRGSGHTIGNGPLLNPILAAGREAYAYDTKEHFAHAEDAWAAGKQMQLVSALQGRNDARITFVGGVETFSNEFFELEVDGGKVANREFAKEVAEWTFQEKGVVNVVGVRHWADGEEEDVNPGMYRVKNDVTFEIELAEYNGDRWAPFTLPSSDSLQLEFTMLDPYYRLPLLPVEKKENSTVFQTSFRVPDQHGVFAFKVNYKRPFLTAVDEKHSVTVRHFAHDEYTRSWDISAAWVWIAGIAVTVGGWVFFCALWLWSAPVAKGKIGKKSQ